MICFPNAKINFGLNVIEKRPDGYHNIETVFYPINLNDALEIVPYKTNSKVKNDTKIIINNFGIDIQLEDVKKNLIYKAYEILDKDFNLPAFNVFLHKNIPFGAGLGGGSSDAAFMLKILNKTLNLGLKESELCEYASNLGADCAFFIKNRPIFASQVGNVFQDIQLSLKGYFLVLVKPNIFISTKDAYENIKPLKREISVKERIKEPIENWKNLLENDFEKVVFKKFPKIKEIKEYLYKQGAIYASMTGSGSSVFGIFKESVSLKNDFKDSYYKEINL